MTQTIKQRCDAIGISLPTYYLRLKNGMTPEEALSTPNKCRASKLKPTPKPAPAPMPEPEDQEPRAPLMVGASCVFESDYQSRRHKFNQNRTKQSTKAAGTNSTKTAPNNLPKPPELCLLSVRKSHSPAVMLKN